MLKVHIFNMLYIRFWYSCINGFYGMPRARLRFSMYWERERE